MELGFFFCVTIGKTFKEALTLLSKNQKDLTLTVKQLAFN